MRALILAAGYSTRLYPLTLNTPKALLPIGGRAMLDYLVDHLSALPELKDVSIVTNARFYPDFSAWAASAAGRYDTLAFEVFDDGTSTDGAKLGAIGDIQFSLDRIGMDDDLLVVACDNFFTAPLNGFMDEFGTHGCDTLLGIRIDDTDALKRFAVATLDEQGCVASLVEKPEIPPSDIAIYAAYLYRRDTLPLFKTYLDEGHSPDAPGHFPEWLYKRKPVRVHLCTGECVDIGTPESYREICARFEGGLPNG